MPVDDEDEDIEAVLHVTKKGLVDIHSHRRHISSGSTGSLPDYRSRHAPSASLSSTLWNVPEDNPPGYTAAAASEHFISPSRRPPSASDADSESEPPSTNSHPSSRSGRRRAFVAHRRSHSGRTRFRPNATDDYATTRDSRTDLMLERSVHALEMSNVLLQSSISTRTALSTTLTGNDHQSHISPFRIDSISRRFAASDVVDAHMDALMASTEDLMNGGAVSQSAPPLSTMHSFLGSQRAISSRRSETSRSGHKPPSPAQNGQPCTPLSSVDFDNLPHTPNTPAYILLSSIGERSSSNSQRRFSEARALTPSLPNLRRGSIRNSHRPHRHDKNTLPHTPVRRARSFDSMGGSPGRRLPKYPKAALVSIISPRFFNTSPSLSAQRHTQGHSHTRPVVAVETITRLRRILMRNEEISQPTAPKHTNNHPLLGTDAPADPHKTSASTSLVIHTPPSTQQLSPLPSPSPSPLRIEINPVASTQQPVHTQPNSQPQISPLTPVRTSRQLGLRVPASSLTSPGRLRYSREGL